MGSQAHHIAAKRRKHLTSALWRMSEGGAVLAVARFPREAPKVAVLKPGTRGEWRAVGLFPRSVAKAIIAAGLADCVLDGARLVALRINAAGRARLDHERASRAARRGMAA